MLFDRRALARFGLTQRGNVPSPARERAENTFGQSYDDVVVHRRAVPGDSEALGAAKGREVYLNPSLGTGGFVEDVVLAHELAHVSQQSTPGPAHGGASLEQDADDGARAQLAGRSARTRAGNLQLSKCVARPAGGLITPSHFLFRELIPIRPGDGEPAGWRAAAVEATMSKDVGGAPYGAVVCRFEVGVPLKNHLGFVGERYAQIEAATAANAAAYAVLSSGTPPSAATVVLFRQTMERLLSVPISGARVSSIIHHDLPISHFP